MSSARKKIVGSTFMPLVDVKVQMPLELREALDAEVKSSRVSLAKFVNEAVAEKLGRRELAEMRRPVGRPKKPVESVA
jgi:hypothetical protein